MMLKSRGSKNYTVALIVVIVLIIAYFYMSRKETAQTNDTKTEKVNNFYND